ncbi:MAG: ATP-binding cassette domain-containing protein [Coprococcus sp.]
MNGTGKTTTMKMMMGLTKVSSGKIKYSGKDIEEKKNYRGC